MTTEDFIISLFCLVDDRMDKLGKRSDATLYPSELVTIGLLFALKGGYFRAFYRWLKRDFETLFVRLPDRTRIQRALRAHRSGVIACWQTLPSSPLLTPTGLN
ncbi:MAG: hypothetical protein HND48_14930 [Chloroflexi bacterium]|nr:hypothetical protein [Chloroflexota bacterium]